LVTGQDVDDLMIRRFLRARSLDVEKASAMFLKYLNWKRSIMPNGYISPSEIAEDIAQEKLFVQGLDKKGRPIIVAFAAKHFQSKHGADGFKRIILTSDPSQFAFRVLLLNGKYLFLYAGYVAFALEKICSRCIPFPVLIHTHMCTLKC